jgi:hypothetical protein
MYESNLSRELRPRRRFIRDPLPPLPRLAFFCRRDPAATVASFALVPLLSSAIAREACNTLDLQSLD